MSSLPETVNPRPGASPLTDAEGEGRVRRSLSDRVFRVAVVAKGLYGVAEVTIGLFLSVVSPAALQQWATILTQQKLSNDPGDFLTSSLVSVVNGLTASSMTFAAFYLIIHGIVKIGLLVAVLKSSYRVYPWAIGILIAFIGYQAYELAINYSLGLLLLTLFDAAIVAPTWREYVHHTSPRESVEPARA